MDDVLENINKFIEKCNWTFAKTYADTWPHEYIVQEKVQNDLFVLFANFIDINGYKELFYQKTVVYLI